MKQSVALGFTLFLPAAVFAAATQPADLMYLNKPIDALCFFNQGSNREYVQLSQCGALIDKLSFKGQNTNLLKKGYIGFDWQSSNAAYPAQGYSYYQFFPAGNHQYWIYTLNNGGGSGEFTALNRVTRKDANQLSVHTIMSGDRCNGGIHGLVAENHRLTFRVNLTAWDVFALAGDNPHQFKAYDDLAACAACCAAEAVYAVDDSLKPQLQHVDFSGHGVKASDMPQQGRYQVCFNNLVAEKLAKGGYKLNNIQLQQFARAFNEQCVA